MVSANETALTTPAINTFIPSLVKPLMPSDLPVELVKMPVSNLPLELVEMAISDLPVEVVRTDGCTSTPRSLCSPHPTVSQQTSPKPTSKTAMRSSQITDIVSQSAEASLVSYDNHQTTSHVSQSVTPNAIPARACTNPTVSISPDGDQATCDSSKQTNIVSQTAPPNLVTPARAPASVCISKIDEHFTPPSTRPPKQAEASSFLKSASLLGSCNKNKQWRELARDEKGHMLMRQVVDLGHQKSSRKKKKKTIEMKETKHKIELEVKNHQKTKPRKSPIMLEKIRRFEDQDQTRKSIPKIKPKFNSEVEKISKLAAKKKQEDEALPPKHAN
jgi:hypothetical protein